MCPSLTGFVQYYSFPFTSFLSIHILSFSSHPFFLFTSFLSIHILSFLSLHLLCIMKRIEVSNGKIFFMKSCSHNPEKKILYNSHLIWTWIHKRGEKIILPSFYSTSLCLRLLLSSHHPCFCVPFITSPLFLCPFHHMPLFLCPFHHITLVSVSCESKFWNSLNSIEYKLIPV